MAGIPKIWRPFRKARASVRRLRLKNLKQWRAYCSGRLPEKGIRPPDIPTTPHVAYRNRGWKSYGDWFGTGNISTSLRMYRSYNQAKQFVHSLGLRGKNQWREYVRGDLRNLPPLPPDIPSAPDNVFRRRGAWKGWGDWVGTGAIATFDRKFLPFASARRFARRLGLASASEWFELIKGLMSKPPLPSWIPRDPRRYYGKKVWKGWADWLGNEPARRYEHLRRPISRKGFIPMRRRKRTRKS